MAFLDPRLIPIPLLVTPQSWTPRDSGIDEEALGRAHPELVTAKDLVSSGRLTQIIRGEAPLYTDLPPIHLEAYLDGLRPGAKKELHRQHFSALEHLATFGWKRFRQGRALGKDLDRYQPEPDETVQAVPPPHNPLPLVLVVLQTEPHPADNKATRHNHFGLEPGHPRPPRGSRFGVVGTACSQRGSGEFLPQRRPLGTTSSTTAESSRRSFTHRCVVQL